MRSDGAVEVHAVTSLRARFERACRKDVDGQTRECVEYLQNPEILLAEFSDSFLMAEAYDTSEQDFRSQELPIAIPRRRSDQVVRRLVASAADLRVTGGEPYRFRYVARDIVPLWTACGAPEGDDEGARIKGLDYVGITREPYPAPVLGVIVQPGTPAPYLALLRALTCLAEVSTESQMERVNKFLFRGLLSLPAAVDLHLLTVQCDETTETTALSQLTRDLADVFSARIREEWQVPNVLRRIFCLQMPHPRQPFDGTIATLWRI